MEEKPVTNTDGIGNCLRQPGQPHYQPPKSMLVKLSQLIKFCDTRTDPAVETKSIGLPADALVPCFLLAIWTISSLQKTSLPVTGTWYHLDNFIVTRQLCPTYQNWQKTRHPDTDANSIKPLGRYH